jgi:hypothetical protein
MTVSQTSIVASSNFDSNKDFSEFTAAVSAVESSGLGSQKPSGGIRPQPK